jgi:hypothetical protein
MLKRSLICVVAGGAGFILFALAVEWLKKLMA